MVVSLDVPQWVVNRGHPVFVFSDTICGVIQRQSLRSWISRAKSIPSSLMAWYYCHELSSGPTQGLGFLIF